LEKDDVQKATEFFNKCFHLSDKYDNTKSDFNATLIGLIKGTAEVIKENCPDTYQTICEALTVMENK
jgi:hypothetical protein